MRLRHLHGRVGDKCGGSRGARPASCRAENVSQRNIHHLEAGRYPRLDGGKIFSCCYCRLLLSFCEFQHFEQWPKDVPICVHAEGRTTAAAILLASLNNRPIHVCHVATREEIEVIKAAKKKVTTFFYLSALFAKVTQLFFVIGIDGNMRSQPASSLPYCQRFDQSGMQRRSSPALGLT